MSDSFTNVSEHTTAAPSGVVANNQELERPKILV